MNLYQVIKKGLVTEKATNAQANFNHYSLAVDPRASKNDIKNAVEKIFDVKIASVKTMQCRGKSRRVGQNVGKTAQWKKAIIVLKAGEELKLVKE